MDVIHHVSKFILWRILGCDFGALQKCSRGSKKRMRKERWEFIKRMREIKEDCELNLMSYRIS